MCARFVLVVDTAGLLGRALLRADNDLPRVLLVLPVGIPMLDVVHPHCLDLGGYATPPSADGDRNRTRRVHLPCPTLHGSRDASPLLVAFDRPLLVPQ